MEKRVAVSKAAAIGRGMVLAEGGYLLPVPRPTTPEEDEQNLIRETEEKLAVGAVSRDELDALVDKMWAAAGIPRSFMTGVKPTLVLLDDPLKKMLEEDK